MDAAPNAILTERSWWQWSLMELLAGTGILAGFIAIGAHLGFDNGLFWLCAIASVVIGIVSVVCLPRGWIVFPALLTTLVMILLCNPGIMFFSLVMAINGALHIAMCLRANAKTGPWTAKQVLARTSGAALFAFSVGALAGYPGYQEIVALQKRHVSVDLSDRLSYETVRIDSESHPGTIQGESEFEGEVDASADYFFGRTRVLEGIHGGRIEMFVKSAGFGVGRFAGGSIASADYPPLQDVGFERLPAEAFAEIENDHWRRYGNQGKGIHDQESLHLTSVGDFMDPRAWGQMIEPKVMRGFVPHAFHRPPQNVGRDFLEAEGLALTELQLVSLNRFAGPRAYVLDHLPRMDQLNTDDVPTRKLTSFERQSLFELRSGAKQVVFQPTDDGLEMFGAIRAYRSCLQCHNTVRGELLGAFTYQFRTVESATGNAND